jgi:hypothetical protein
MKLVAGALAKAKVVTPIIGVAPFHKITDKKRFFDAEHDRGSGTRHWLRVHYFKRTDNTDASHALDTQHTHFLLVDDGIRSDWGSEIEFRGKVEEKISEHLRVPRVQLVIQGGPNTLKTVADTLGPDHRRSCHVVIVKESGGCARAIAEFVEPLLQEAELFLNPELLKRRVNERLKDAEFEARLKVRLRARPPIRLPVRLPACPPTRPPAHQRAFCTLHPLQARSPACLLAATLCHGSPLPWLTLPPGAAASGAAQYHRIVAAQHRQQAAAAARVHHHRRAPHVLRHGHTQGDRLELQDAQR